MAGAIGGEREALLDAERLGDVALEPEAVRFQVAAVRSRRRADERSRHARHGVVTGRLKASARWAIFMKGVMPPQLVTSGSG